MHKLDARRWTLDDGLITRSQLGTKCAQYVSEVMDNWWVQYPQAIQNLWTTMFYRFTYSPSNPFTTSFSALFSTVLSAAKIRQITDKTSYLSTLSTPPIITTTTYI